MAPETGYGDALCQRFQSNVSCLNLAKGGRSSASYRAEGSWSGVVNTLSQKQHNQTTFVLIQFGHNDQPGKPGRSTDLTTEFPLNITNYVHDVQAAGAIPVLVTPLTRRSFQDTKLQNDLRAWAEATILVAEAEHVALLDLNADSFSAVQTMGSAMADTLAMAPPVVSNGDTVASKDRGYAYRGFDHTHLGSKGAQLFSAMVKNELITQVPVIASHVKEEPSLP